MVVVVVALVGVRCQAVGNLAKVQKWLDHLGRTVTLRDTHTSGRD